MTQTEQFIRRLGALQEGERSQLRRLAGQPLDKTLHGFDLFTGLWWPLRQKVPTAPRRETSWLVAKLFGAFPIPYIAGDQARLPMIMGRLEPSDEYGRRRFRRRFDALLQSSLPNLEPHLRWAISLAADAVGRHQSDGLDWAQLLDHLSVWDRGEEHRRGCDIRDIWAEEYLKVASRGERR